MRPLDEQRFRCAVRCLALHTAKTRVIDQLRAEGLKVSHYSCREINDLRQAYFDQHWQELINKALIDVWKLRSFARYRPQSSWQWAFNPNQRGSNGVYPKVAPTKSPPVLNCRISNVGLSTKRRSFVCRAAEEVTNFQFPWSAQTTRSRNAPQQISRRTVPGSNTTSFALDAGQPKAMPPTYFLPIHSLAA